MQPPTPHDLLVRESRTFKMLGIALPMALLALAAGLTHIELLPRPVLIYCAVVAACWILLYLPQVFSAMAADNWVLVLTGDELWIKDAGLGRSVNELARGARPVDVDRRPSREVAARRLSLSQLISAGRMDETTVSWSTRQVKRKTRRCWLELRVAPDPAMHPNYRADDEEPVRVLWRSEQHWRSPSIERALSELRRRGVRIEPAQRRVRDLTD